MSYSKIALGVNLVSSRYEVNNLDFPHSAIVFIEASYSDGSSHTGSGTFIDPYHVLTAGHVLLGKNGELPETIRVVPGYDPVPEGGEPGTAPFGTFYGIEAAFFNDFDPDHDGVLSPGDNQFATSLGSEKDIAVIKLSNVGTPHHSYMQWGVGFTNGMYYNSGYPAETNRLPVERYQEYRRDGVDSLVLQNRLGPGSSGGPVWKYVNGVPTVFGIVSTDWSTLLDPHADWIRDYQAFGSGSTVGTSRHDVFTPLKAEFVYGRETNFQLKAFGANWQEYQFPFMTATIEGGSGVDTLALDIWSSTFKFADAQMAASAAYSDIEGWSLYWTKGSNGEVTGAFEGYSSMSFSGFERIAFADGVVDLTAGQVGVRYYLGAPPSFGSYTPYPGALMGLGAVKETKTGTASADRLSGSSYSDEISSLGGADSVTGAAGDDTLKGGDGADTLRGGSGKDTISGGKGHDGLTGGTGADQFKFDATLVSANADNLTDFKHGEDKIAFSTSIFAALGSSVTSSEFGAKTSGHLAANYQHIIYDKSNGTLWYDADDNGDGEAVQFATLSNKPQNLTYADFVIV